MRKVQEEFRAALKTRQDQHQDTTGASEPVDDGIPFPPLLGRGGPTFGHDPDEVYLEDIELSPDQEDACHLLLKKFFDEDEQELELSGPAGSGKTTLVRDVIRRIEEEYGTYVHLLTPTGRAAVRLCQVTGRPVATIHSVLYGGPTRDAKGNLVWSDPGPPCSAGEVVVVDEASMVGGKLADAIRGVMPADSKLLAVGDKEQLPPVKDTWGFNLGDPTALLTKIHRQAAGNPIIAMATAIREDRFDEWADEYGFDDERLCALEGYDTALEWAVERAKKDADAVCLVFTNRLRQRLNREIRVGVGLPADDVLVAGDKLLVRVNNRRVGVMNGEVFTVESVEERPGEADVYGSSRVVEVYVEETDQPLLINMDHFNGDRNAWWEWKKLTSRRDQRWVHCHHGWALTVHSAQGSQWDDVAFLWDRSFSRLGERNPDDARRMLYTAVTRAAKNLAVVTV